MAVSTANSLRPPLPENKRYLKVMAQQGKPVAGADLNDQACSFLTQIRRLVSNSIGTGAKNLAFKVEEATSPTNNFKLRGGEDPADGPETLFLAGYGIGLFADQDFFSGADVTPVSTALTATVLTDSAAFFVSGALVGRSLTPDVIGDPGTSFTIVSNTVNTITVTGDMTTVAQAGNNYRINLEAPSVNEQHIVYIDFFEDPVAPDGPTGDPDLLHLIGTDSIETTHRIKGRGIVHVFEGDLTSYISFRDGLKNGNGEIIASDSTEHFFSALATVDRLASDTQITTAMITDLRTLIVPLDTVDSRYVNATGDTMTGALNMQADVAFQTGSKITGTDIVDTAQVVDDSITQAKLDAATHILGDGAVVPASSTDVTVHDNRYTVTSKISSLFGSNLLVNDEFSTPVVGLNGAQQPAAWVANFPQPLDGGALLANGAGIDTNGVKITLADGCFCCCTTGINVLMRLGANVQYLTVMEQIFDVDKGGLFQVGGDFCYITGGNNVLPFIELDAFSGSDFFLGMFRHFFYDDAGALVRMIPNVTSAFRLNRLVSVPETACSITMRVGFIVDPIDSTVNCGLTQDLDLVICRLGINKWGKNCGLDSLQNEKHPNPIPLIPVGNPPVNRIPNVNQNGRTCTSDKQPAIGGILPLFDAALLVADAAEVEVIRHGPVRFAEFMCQERTFAPPTLVSTPIAICNVFYDATDAPSQVSVPTLFAEDAINVPTTIHTRIDSPIVTTIPASAADNGYVGGDLGGGPSGGNGFAVVNFPSIGTVALTTVNDLRQGFQVTCWELSTGFDLSNGTTARDSSARVELDINFVTGHASSVIIEFIDDNGSIAVGKFASMTPLPATWVHIATFLRDFKTFGAQSFNWSKIQLVRLYWHVLPGPAGPAKIQFAHVKFIGDIANGTLLDTTTGNTIARWGSLRATFTHNPMLRRSPTVTITDLNDRFDISYNKKESFASALYQCTAVEGSIGDYTPLGPYLYEINVGDGDNPGTPLSNIQVTATGADGSVFTVISDANGFAELVGLNPGTDYTITFVDLNSVKNSFQPANLLINGPIKTVPSVVSGFIASSPFSGFDLRTQRTSLDNGGLTLADSDGNNRLLKFGKVTLDQTFANTLETGCQNLLIDNVHLVDHPCQHDELSIATRDVPDSTTCCPFSSALITRNVVNSTIDTNLHFIRHVAADAHKRLPDYLGRTLAFKYLDAQAGVWKQGTSSQLVYVGGGRAAPVFDVTDPSKGPADVPKILVGGTEYPIYLIAALGSGMHHGVPSPFEAVLGSDKTVSSGAGFDSFIVDLGDVQNIGIGDRVWIHNARDSLSVPVANSRFLYGCEIEKSIILEQTGLYGAVTAIDPPSRSVTITFDNAPSANVTFAVASDAVITRTGPGQSMGFMVMPSLGMAFTGPDAAASSLNRFACIEWEFQEWNAHKQGVCRIEPEHARLVANAKNGVVNYPFFGFSERVLADVDFVCEFSQPQAWVHDVTSDLIGGFAQETITITGAPLDGGEQIQVDVVFTDPICGTTATFTFREGIEFASAGTITGIRDNILTAMQTEATFTSLLTFASSGVDSITVTAKFFGAAFAITITITDPGAAQITNPVSTGGTDATVIPIDAFLGGADNIAVNDCVRITSDAYIQGTLHTVTVVDPGAPSITVTPPVPPCVSPSGPFAGYLVVDDVVVFGCATCGFNALGITSKFDSLPNAISNGSVVLNPGVNQFVGLAPGPGDDLELLAPAGVWPIPIPMNAGAAAKAMLWIPHLGCLRAGIGNGASAIDIDFILARTYFPLATPAQVSGRGYLATFSTKDASRTLQSPRSKAIAVSTAALYPFGPTDGSYAAPTIP